MPARPTDPLTNFRFAVEIEGVTQAAFSACDGLEIVVDVIEVAHGSDRRNAPQKLPGLARPRNIVLRRGLTRSSELWDWFKTVVDGNVQRRAGSLILLDAAREEQLRFNFFEAWPCRWKSFELDAGRTGAVVEELEIVVEHIERA